MKVNDYSFHFNHNSFKQYNHIKLFNAQKHNINYQDMCSENYKTLSV